MLIRRNVPLVKPTTRVCLLTGLFVRELPPRLQGGGTSTSQGRSYGIFQKAIQRRKVVAADWPL